MRGVSSPFHSKYLLGVECEHIFHLGFTTDHLLQYLTDD